MKRFEANFHLHYDRWEQLDFDQMSPHELKSLYDEMEDALLWNWKAWHPDSIAALGAQLGSAVTITSPHDSIPAVLEPDDTLRRDVIAMHHAFGGLVAEDSEFRDRGSNVGRLVPTDIEYDAITGLPRQGNIPVRVTAGTAGNAR